MNASPDSAKPPLGELIGRLSALHQKRIDLGLERMHRLLERLGHPESKLPPVIHIAGTNGKGSTLAYLRATLEAAGLRVHAYTSPYLVRINECFRLGRHGDHGKRLAGEQIVRYHAGDVGDHRVGAVDAVENAPVALRGRPPEMVAAGLFGVGL